MKLIVTINVTFDFGDPNPKAFDITELEEEISGVVSGCQGFENKCWVGPVSISFISIQGAKPTEKSHGTESGQENVGGPVAKRIEASKTGTQKRTGQTSGSPTGIRLRTKRRAKSGD